VEWKREEKVGVGWAWEADGLNSAGGKDHSTTTELFFFANICVCVCMFVKIIIKRNRDSEQIMSNDTE